MVPGEVVFGHPPDIEAMNFKLKLDPLVVFQKIDGQEVLFSKKTGDFFGLNESAAFMLKELISSDFETATKISSDTFGVDHSIIREDLQELVDSLIAGKLASRHNV